MNEQDKKIRELLQGHFEEANPSEGFTTSIMQKIKQEKSAEPLATRGYVPVISKRVWFVIGVFFMLVIYFGLTTAKGVSFSWSSYELNWQQGSGLLFSKYVMFALLSIFGLLLIDRFLKPFMRR